jgi:hypothetical protein
MNSDRGTGASPGQQGNANPGVQTGQPNSQNDLNSGQPGQPNLELLYQLSAEDRAAIMALPPEVRNPAVAALDKARIDQENGFNTKLEEGRQAIANMNALYADPRFQDFLMGNSQQAPPTNTPAVQSTASNGLYETPEQAQQANAIIEDMARKISESLNINELSAAVQNIQRGMLQNSQQRDWEALKEFTKENNLPDPDSMRSKIALTQRDNPGLTLDQAYTANVDLMALQTRPPITDTGNEQNTNTEDGNGGLPVPNTETVVEDPVEAAYKRAEEGKRIDPEGGFKDSFSESIAAYNAEHGTSFEPDDFQI